MLINEILDTFRPAGLDDIDNYRLMNRIDTKYLISVKKVPELMLRMNGDYRVLDINNNRIFSYYTTYLDTDDFMFYNQHVTGRLSRNKVRYRKYETTGLRFLEIKHKTNKNRTIKWRIEHNPSPGNECDNIACEFINEYLPYKALSLKPVLISSFNRITLLGSELNERITIDSDLSYFDLEGNRAGFPFLAIIEHKRERVFNGSPMVKILKDNQIHATGFSKYCFGTALMNENIQRKNIIKPKFLLINKIENDYNRFSDT